MAVLMCFDKFLQISRTQYNRVHGYIEAGKKEGAKVIFGGEKRSGKGFFIDPTSQPFDSIPLVNTHTLHGQFSPTSNRK
jgi:hypothetical protein